MLPRHHCPLAPLSPSGPACSGLALGLARPLASPHACWIACAPCLANSGSVTTCPDLQGRTSAQASTAALEALMIEPRAQRVLVPIWLPEIPVKVPSIAERLPRREGWPGCRRKSEIRDPGWLKGLFGSFPHKNEVEAPVAR